MYSLAIAQKTDVVSLTDELGLTTAPNADLIALITGDENYDDEFTKACLQVISAERQENKVDIESQEVTGRSNEFI